MSRSKEFYLLLLEHALLEVRALSWEGGNLAVGPQLADMFHNVPGALRLPWTADREERITAQVRAKAEVYGLTEQLERWERHVLNRLEREGDAAQVTGTSVPG